MSTIARAVSHPQLSRNWYREICKKLFTAKQGHLRENVIAPAFSRSGWVLFSRNIYKLKCAKSVHVCQHIIIPLLIYQWLIAAEQHSTKLTFDF